MPAALEADVEVAVLSIWLRGLESVSAALHRSSVFSQDKRAATHHTFQLRPVLLSGFRGKHRLALPTERDVHGSSQVPSTASVTRRLSRGWPGRAYRRVRQQQQEHISHDSIECAVGDVTVCVTIHGGALGQRSCRIERELVQQQLLDHAAVPWPDGGRQGHGRGDPA